MIPLHRSRLEELEWLHGSTWVIRNVGWCPGHDPGYDPSKDPNRIASVWIDHGRTYTTNRDETP